MNPSRQPIATERLILFSGDDVPEIRKRIEGETAAFLGKESNAPFALEKYFSHQQDLKEEVLSLCERILESIRTAPAFTRRKVIVWEAAPYFSGEKPKKAEDITEFFGEIARSAAGSSAEILTLVWIPSSWDPKVFGVAQELYRLERFIQADNAKPLKVRVLEKIRSAGKRIQEKDLDEWLRSSPNEEEVWKALDQIVLSLGKNVEISRLQLEPYFGFELDRDTFAFSNALARRDREKVLSLLHQASEIEGEPPQVTLSKIISFFIQLKAFRSLWERVPIEKRRFTKDRRGIYSFPDSLLGLFKGEARPGPETDLMSKHPYVVKGYLSAALDYETVDLDAWLEELQLADERLKSTGIDAKYLLEGVFTRLLGRSSEVRAS